MNDVSRHYIRSGVSTAVCDPRSTHCGTLFRTKTKTVCTMVYPSSNLMSCTLRGTRCTCTRMP